MDMLSKLLKNFVTNVLKCGPIPKHAAFIMDGNRRYASKNKIAAAEGHRRGSDNLTEILKACHGLGICEVTLYAFSIENFKRSKEEIDVLMKLVEEYLKRILGEIRQIMEHGVCIRVLGDISLLSDELKELIAEVVLKTRNNTQLFLNVGLAYTSREEIACSVNTVVEGVRKGMIHVDDIDEELVSRCLYTSRSPDPDLIIRTSGEVRFSDFLLWQIAGSCVCFPKVFWPDFSIWHLFHCVMQYQRCVEDLEKFRNFKDGEKVAKEEEAGVRVEKFCQETEYQRMLQLKSYCQGN